MSDLSLPPGIYDDVGYDQYHALDAVSSGRLRALQRSPLHLWHAIYGEQQPTRAMDLGTAVHMLMLEPARFADHYVEADQCMATTSKGFRCSRTGAVRLGGEEWYCTQHAGDTPGDEVTILTPELVEHSNRSVEALLRHPHIRRALEGEDVHFERVAVWDDDAGAPLLPPLRCKMMADVWIQRDLTLADVKTASSARKSAFGRAAGNRGYHLQAGHYALGFEAATGEKCHRWEWWVVEPYPPYAVAVYELDALDLEGAKMLVRQLYGTYARALDAEAWTSYNEAPEPIFLPAWALDDLETDEATDYAELF